MQLRKDVKTIMGLLWILLTGFAVAQAEELPLLKEIYADYFEIGFAARQSFWLDEPLLDHFNTVTAENIMKWESIHPRPHVYNFLGPDELVSYAQEHGMSVVGHTLIWHNQTPAWVFTDEKGQDVSREVLLARMEEHIKTVMGRYRGQVKGWDVVNEAIEQNPKTGQWELRASKWKEIIGDDFIAHAFQFAQEADPQAELYYNDYSATDPGKRDAIYALVKNLLAEGIRVDGLGMQGHWDLDAPSAGLMRAAIEKYSSLGVKVHISELDISVFSWGDRSNRYSQGLPAEASNRLAERYASVFRLLREYAPVIERVTFWGVQDNHSWKNNFPVPGRKDYPLLFDSQGQAKPAFWAVVDPTRPWREVREGYLQVARPSQAKNVVLNRPLTTSGDGQRARRAVDGSQATSWTVAAAGARQWLAVELEQDYVIERWLVQHAGAGTYATVGPGSELFNTSDYALQKSEDGLTWTTVDEVKNNTAAFTDRKIEPFITRHLRLLITKPTSVEGNQRMSIVEFEVYGLPPG